MVASVELRGEDTPRQEALSETAWVAGTVYFVRLLLDLTLRVPLYWGPIQVPTAGWTRWRRAGEGRGRAPQYRRPS